MTFEFWIKPNSIQQRAWPISWYGVYTAGFKVQYLPNQYTWSTGDTTTSVTVNPQDLPYVWVTDGTCTDTVWFNNVSGTYVDTVYVTVTDTLLIDMTISGINPPDNTNTIRVYPNPSMDHVTVDFGDYAMMAGYSFRITNSIGQVLYLAPVSQQSVYLNLASWGGPGLYFVDILDPQNASVVTRHVVLQ